MWGSVPTLSLKARALLLCLTLWLPAAAGVYAGGQPEASLEGAQKLFNEQDYTGALKLLTAVQRKDPNLRDEVGRLMAQIMAVTLQYNKVLEALNKAIEASDVEAMKTLIPELHRIDPVRAAGLTRQAESLIGILKLMNEAEGLLRAGKTAEALALYILPFTQADKSGVTLPSSQFESSGYGEIITSNVKRAIAAIVATTQDQLKSVPDLAPVVPAVKSLLDPPSAAAPDLAARFDAVTAPLLAAAASEGGVRSGAASLVEIGRSIQQASDKGRDNLYLRYVLWLCLGRDNKQEGIAHAMDLLWADEALQIQQITGAAATDAFQSARTAFDSGALAASDAAFQDFQPRSALAVKSSGLLSARFRFNPGSGWSLPEGDTPVMKAALGRALTVQEYAAEAVAYRLLIVYRKELDALPSPAFAAMTASPGSLSAESARLVSARSSLDTRSVEARTQEASWTARGKSWESAAGVTEASASLAESARRVASLFRAFAATDLRSRDIAYALRIAAIGGASFPGRLASAVSLRTKAQDLKDGTADGLKHPDQAVDSLTTAAGNLDSLIADLVAHEQKIQGDRDYVKASPGFAALFEGSPGQPGYNAILRSAQAERAGIDPLIAASKTLIQSAAVASREGDNNFEEAKKALDNNDPDGAGSALVQADEAYFKSLADEYTDHAASRTTTEKDAINNRIVDLQNRISVAAAQRAVIAINKLIVTKDFLGASDALDTAERSWSQNHDPDNTYPPFDNLRLTIQAAVELSQGREISRLDAKADVVNAFIRNARDNLAAGKLAEAMQNVMDALVVAPNYGAAKVLQLMIKKQTDPAGFERDAAADIARFVKMGQDDKNKEGQKTAYRALLDYSKLDARYEAQLKKPIQELEYSLGLARRPPTPQQIAQSNQRVQEAAARQQGGTLDDYLAALDIVKQALTIWPENPDALRLDGLIRTRMGSTVLGALSPVDSQAYHHAYDLDISGRYQEALDEVNKIYNDPRSPRNKTYGPLKLLKKRLENRLNQ